MSESEQRSYKAPPAFKEGECYDDWKLDIELWKEFTSLAKKKQGTALLLELKEGKVKNAVRSLGKDVLAAEDGLDKIVAHLDKIYKEDAAHLTYRVYCKFEKYERPENMNLQSYMAEFEKMLADLKRHNITLPEEVMAYRVLNSANMPPEKVDLALATVKALTYKDMCTTIGKIFFVQSNMPVLDQVNAPVVKTEPEECNLASHSQWRKNDGRGTGSYKGPMRNQRGFTRGFNNPYPRGGRTRYQSGCFSCGGKGHFARECPKRRNHEGGQFFIENGLDSQTPSMEVEDFQDAYITLLACKSEVAMTKEDCLMSGQPDLGSLVYETLACAVIDSACTKTVVGRSWVNHYIETLDEDQKKLMTVEKCSTPFRFGDGKEAISREQIKIPGRIGKNKILIEANVVDCEIPLLLSKPALKKAGAVISFSDDKMQFNGETIDLMECKSGHYCVPICNKRRLALHDSGAKLVLTVTPATLMGNSDKEIKQKALKLHRQFSHAPAYKLKTLLKNAGFEKKEYLAALDYVCDNCEICQRYRKPKPRPVVGLPRGRTFNECVAMDLKKIADDMLILHMIDTVTRFSVAKIVSNKRKETIVGAICLGWISLFGSPSKFMADNGGEFANED